MIVLTTKKIQYYPRQYKVIQDNIITPYNKRTNQMHKEYVIQQGQNLQ